MNGEAFTFDMSVLRARGSDIILGMDWVKLVVPIMLYTRPLSIYFFRGDKVITLMLNDMGRWRHHTLSLKEVIGLGPVRAINPIVIQWQGSTGGCVGTN